MNESLKKRAEDYIHNMPSLPISALKVMEVCNNPHSSPADLNYVISLDPVLTGRVLKLINSAYYGLSQDVTTLVRAIIMLGLNTVKNLALSSAVLQNLRGTSNAKAIDMDAFWRHSLGVGVASKLLAKKRCRDSKRLEEYFTAGLLHDIGKIPLNAVAPDAYTVTVKAAKQKRQHLIRAENKLLGINHCTCGEWIVNAWKLQGPVGDVIIHHHDCGAYRGPYRDLLYNVALANYFIQQCKIGFAGDSYPELPPETWEVLKVNPDSTQALSQLVTGEIERAQIFLKL
ncbi:MAG: HDOD domain-containing protein [Treponema sp.]|jgi:HD-like signal output (HDOD) protein|nr:HDOD domain-containing protein [Treponema sp.]